LHSRSLTPAYVSAAHNLGAIRKRVGDAAGARAL